MSKANIKSVMSKVNGSSFVGLDFEVNVPLAGGKSNPFQGRVTKRTINASVMVFQNKNGSAYDAMVKRRLEKEGKNPDSFQLSPRKWGERVPNTPFITHTPKGQTVEKVYLEVIFLKGGESKFYVDGKLTAREDIPGIAEGEAEQGGLENKVIIRTFSLESIRSVRIDGTEYAGPFEYV